MGIRLMVICIIINFVSFFGGNNNKIAMRHLLRGARRFSESSEALLKSRNIHKFVQGDFPEAMLYSRPFHLSKLDNGITVASEIMPNGIASLSVFVKCGSRNETAESSGTAHFLEHLHFKGTINRSRHELEVGVENMGGSLNAYTSRENTSYMMTVFKDDLPKAVEIVGDMISNSLYAKRDVENERGTIYRELLETRKSMPMETTIEISHQGIFKEHVMGLPILGSIENMRTISKQDIQEYHDQNYVGENIILVAAGPIDHAQLVEAAQKHLKMPRQAQKKQEAISKPLFIPGLSFLDSHLTEKVNMSVIYEAPSFYDNEFFTYLLLQRLLSDRPETDLELEIMKNTSLFKFQKYLAQFDYIDKQKGFYSSYYDTGLFGNYFLCEPSKAGDVINHSLEGLLECSKQVTDSEIERAKRRVFVEILQHETQNDITQSIANNLMYYDRKVETKELAERVACVGAKEIQNLASKLLDVNKIHVCVWGNTKKCSILQQ